MKKRINPIDLLDLEDRQAYQQYIMRALQSEVRPHIGRSLAEWNKQKRTLFRALGHQLRVTVPIEINKSEREFSKELRKIYTVHTFYNTSTCKHYRDSVFRDDLVNFSNCFIPLYYKHICNLYINNELNLAQLRSLCEIVYYENVIKGYINVLNIPAGIKINNYTIKCGAKTIKTIGRILKEIDFPDLAVFEEWRNLISNITTTKKIKCNLTLSIHPLDFLSLSDNNCDWSSCYQLLGDGMHKEATVAHMNSNCAIVAYLESHTPFLVDGFDVPNKRWREIIYVHKDIIAGGRSYPFENAELTKKVLDIVRKIVYNNLNWKYQYGIQEYKDMLDEYCNTDIRYGYNRRFYGHKIKLYIGKHGGYDDFIEHKDETFYCCRNYVEYSKYIRITGKITCLLCGKDHSNTNLLICEDCAHKHACNRCGCITKNLIRLIPTSYGISHICEKCIKDFIYVSTIKLWIPKKNLPIEFRYRKNQKLTVWRYYTYEEKLLVDEGRPVIGTFYSV